MIPQAALMQGGVRKGRAGTGIFSPSHLIEVQIDLPCGGMWQAHDDELLHCSGIQCRCEPGHKTAPVMRHQYTPAPELKCRLRLRTFTAMYCSTARDRCIASSKALYGKPHSPEQLVSHASSFSGLSGNIRSPGQSASQARRRYRDDKSSLPWRVRLALMTARCVTLAT